MLHHYWQKDTTENKTSEDAIQRLLASEGGPKLPKSASEVRIRTHGRSDRKAHYDKKQEKILKTIQVNCCAKPNISIGPKTGYLEVRSFLFLEILEAS